MGHSEHHQLSQKQSSVSKTNRCLTNRGLQDMFFQPAAKWSKRSEPKAQRDPTAKRTSAAPNGPAIFAYNWQMVSFENFNGLVAQTCGSMPFNLLLWLSYSKTNMVFKRLHWLMSMKELSFAGWISEGGNCSVESASGSCMVGFRQAGSSAETFHPTPASPF